MNRKILLTALLCISFATVSRTQTKNNELPTLKGEWKLDSIVQKQGEKKLTAFSPSKIIPKNIHYSCPVKVSFKEQAGTCRLLYEDGEAKDVFCYAYKINDDILFHVSLPNNTPVPEWMFDYHLTATQFHLHLMLEHNVESSLAKIQYEYFYSLIK
jgi:hypothetical protein